MKKSNYYLRSDQLQKTQEKAYKDFKEYRSKIPLSKRFDKTNDTTYERTTVSVQNSQIVPINYINPEKVIETVARVHKVPISLVKRVLEDHTEYLEEWLKFPHTRGGFKLPQLGTFRINHVSARGRLPKAVSTVRHFKKMMLEDSTYEFEYTQSLSKLKELWRRYKLAQQYWFSDLRRRFISPRTMK